MVLVAPLVGAPPAAAAEQQLPRAVFTFVRETNNDAEIWTMDGSGGTQKRLTHRPGLDLYPTWSPDGSRIAWTHGRDGLGGTNQLWLMNADGTQKDRIHLDRAFRGDVADPTWAPDGRRLVFTTNRSLYLIDADGSRLRRLLAVDMAARTADWSPDGKWIAFTGGLASGDELWLVRPDGSGLHRLQTLPGGVFWPEWAPDGSRIAYSTLHEGRSSVGIMRRDGTGAHRIVDDAGLGGAAWSPFGKRLVFTADDPDGTSGIYRSSRSGENVDPVGLRPVPAHASDPDYRPAPGE